MSGARLGSSSPFIFFNLYLERLAGRAIFSGEPRMTRIT